MKTGKLAALILTLAIAFTSSGCHMAKANWSRKDQMNTWSQHMAEVNVGEVVLRSVGAVALSHAAGQAMYAALLPNGVTFR